MYRRTKLRQKTNSPLLRNTRAYDIKDGPAPQTSVTQRRKESIKTALNTVTRSISKFESAYQQLEALLESLQKELQLIAKIDEQEPSATSVQFKIESSYRSIEICDMISECAKKTRIQLEQSLLFVPKLTPKSSVPTTQLV